ncbi:hypothetical protein M885DRAFT_289531 [Pelagophyceae sp. CCMP2097]|nr:hypothetical protein M885DRAFT_289531 [Pelagophyceae sp. CCMP2097]
MDVCASAKRAKARSTTATLSAKPAHDGTLVGAASALRRRAQAQSSSLVALCLGRVAWRLRSCACLLKAAGRCGAVAEEDAEESEVNVHQLRAAFEIADADGEDDAAAADCADAAGAIMCSGTIAHRARRGALRPGLEKFAQTLTFDEFVLLSTRSLNAQTRRQTHQRLDACLVRAANCGFAAWAAAEVRPAVQGFDKHLELHVQEWATCAGQFDKAKRLDRLKAAARWRLRSLDVETAAGDAAVEEARLPCELSAGCAALLHALHDSLAKAVCGADFVAQAGDEA